MVAYIRSPGGDGAPVMTTPTARAAHGPAGGSGKLSEALVRCIALRRCRRQKQVAPVRSR